eukprot:COSAG02_NODE_13_length_57813_cov_14.298276_2_plen_352_part_00
MRLALFPILLVQLLVIGVTGVELDAAEGVTQLHCSLNGELVDGKCRCDPQWEGDDCQLLKLLPADPHAGLQAVGNFSSWGGSVESDAAGTWHMYVAVMAHGCGLNAWRPNSQIGHATSSTPAGPYTLQQIILPHFAHSPDIVRGVDGEWLVYHVGAGTNNTTHCPDPAANTCRWTTNCSRGCTGPEHPWLSGLGFYGPASVLKASSPDGPWTDAVIGACKDVPGCEPHGAYPGNGNDQNPAPFINADGSVTMLWRSINYTKGSGQSVRSDTIMCCEPCHCKTTILAAASADVLVQCMVPRHSTMLPRAHQSGRGLTRGTLRISFPTFLFATSKTASCALRPSPVQSSPLES